MSCFWITTRNGNDSLYVGTIVVAVVGVDVAVVEEGRPGAVVGVVFVGFDVAIKGFDIATSYFI